MWSACLCNHFFPFLFLPLSFSCFFSLHLFFFFFFFFSFFFFFFLSSLFFCFLFHFDFCFNNYIVQKGHTHFYSSTSTDLQKTKIYNKFLLNFFFQLGCMLIIYIFNKEHVETFYANIYICHHHHHVVLPARISLTISRHSSLSFIASGRSSGLHPVSSHSCCM